MIDWLTYCDKTSTSFRNNICLKKYRNSDKLYNIWDKICNEDKEWLADMMITKIPIYNNKKLHIILGPQASGKGFLTNKYNLLDNHTLSCNYDQIIDNRIGRNKEDPIQRLSSYYLWKQAYNNRGVCVKQGPKPPHPPYPKEISSLSLIDNFIQEIALNDGYNLIWETTGLNVEWIPKEIKKFRNKDYEIIIHLPITNFFLLKDNILRRMSSEGQTGDIKLLDEKISIILFNLTNLYKKVDKTILYDNYSYDIDNFSLFDIFLIINRDGSTESPINIRKKHKSGNYLIKNCHIIKQIIRYLIYYEKIITKILVKLDIETFHLSIGKLIKKRQINEFIRILRNTVSYKYCSYKITNRYDILKKYSKKLTNF